MHVSMLVLGRALLGLGMGAADQAGPQLVSEMAPPWLRGSLNSGFQLAIIVGFFASSCINFGAYACVHAFAHACVRRACVRAWARGRVCFGPRP